jgi:AraC-like DNA-binding protein
MRPLTLSRFKRSDRRDGPGDDQPANKLPALQQKAKGSGFFFTQQGTEADEEEGDDTRITLLIQRTVEERSDAAPADPVALVHKQPALDIPGIQHVGADTFTPRLPQGLGICTEREGWFLGYVSSGRCDWFAREHIYELRPGSLCLVPPMVPHGGFDHVIQNCRCYWALIDPAALVHRPEDAAQLKSQLGQLRNVSFFGGLNLESLFQRLIEAVHSDQPLADLQARCAAIMLLSEAIRAESEVVEAVRNRSEALPEVLKQATAMFSQDVSSIPTVGQVASACKVSRGHLHRMFVQHLGVSPKAYVQEMRLRRARDLLKTGANVRDVAQQVSLATAGELRRLFLQALGCQPEQWLSRHAHLWQAGGLLPGQQPD